MKRVLLLSLLSVALLGSALSAQATTQIWNDTHKPERPESALHAAGDACDREVGVQHGYPSAEYKRCMGRFGWRFGHLRAEPKKPKVITFNRDSKDPNVGWHWENGMRTCTQDCENPEAPGSGYTCTYHDGWRECVR